MTFLHLCSPGRLEEAEIILLHADREGEKQLISEEGTGRIRKELDQSKTLQIALGLDRKRSQKELETNHLQTFAIFSLMLARD